MHGKLRLAYFAHSLRSDWNNGNAHFLRGLLRNMVGLGHDVLAFEPCTEWSIQHLREEKEGERSLQQFAATYPELSVFTYTGAQSLDLSFWRKALAECDIVILHEWNPPALSELLLELRDEIGFRLLFHDTHHRATSSPEQIRRFGVDRFDGVLAFGEVLSSIYRRQFGISRVWTLHEAADTSVFHPLAQKEKTTDVVWIGNWGDDERSAEIREFLLKPAAALPHRSFIIHGVRYPDEGMAALQEAGVRYEGYLPNLDAPSVYAGSRLTVHIPRQQYAIAMDGIPTIRVFEAMACGIPLISAPWRDSEELFTNAELTFVKNGEAMRRAIEKFLNDPHAAAAQALRGLETILAHHTCLHRAEQLTSICEELLH